MKKISFILLFVLFASTGLQAQSNACPACPECPSCEEKKDLSDWQLSAALGFNLTRGNSDTLLANSQLTADREINDHIYHASLSGSFGEDDSLDDEENGSVSQKQAKAEATYKHLLTPRLYVYGGGSAFFDQVADVDYRYILSTGLGVFLLKQEILKLSVEAGPSYVFEKLGGEKSDYFSPRFAERFDWQISDHAKLFQTLEVLLSVEDGDDTLTTAELGLEAALNSHLALVVSIKDVYDNKPAEDKERNDLGVFTSIKASL